MGCGWVNEGCFWSKKTKKKLTAFFLFYFYVHASCVTGRDSGLLLALGSGLKYKYLQG